LGLAIVRAIADHHGARIVLGESPGGGLHATVSFPQLAPPLRLA
jgi:signal transduction histidine kinase